MLYPRNYIQNHQEEEKMEQQQQTAFHAPLAVWNQTHIDARFGQLKQYVVADLSAIQSVIDKFTQKELDMRLDMLYVKAESAYRDKQLAEKDEEIKKVANQVQYLTEKFSNHSVGSSMAPNHTGTTTSAKDEEAEMKLLEDHIIEHPYHSFYLQFHKKAKELGKIATVEMYDGSKRLSEKDTLDVILALERQYGSDVVTRNIFNNDARLRSLVMQNCMSVK